jgi:aquaporin Z
VPAHPPALNFRRNNNNEETPMPIVKRAAAELLGTFWLVLGGVGTVVLASRFSDIGSGLIGIALAFGLTVVTMVYAVGHISGGHFNPAVTIGLFAGGRFKAAAILPYVIAQLIGAVLAAWLVATIAAGNGTDAVAAGLGANGFGEHSPGQYSLAAVLMTEVVMTFFFLLVILGATSEGAPAGFAPLAIGLALTLIHLISIPVSGTSVNPARSTGPALIVGGWAIHQLWLFWLAPIVGAVIAGGTWKWLGKK